jgi:hypothetical protein
MFMNEIPAFGEVVDGDPSIALWLIGWTTGCCIQVTVQPLAWVDPESKVRVFP